MKSCVNLSFLLLTIAYASAQEKSILQLGASTNGMFYNSHTNTLFRTHPDGDIEAGRFSMYLATTIIGREKISWKAGGTWIRTNYRFVDRIHSVEFNDIASGGGNIYVHHDYADPVDLVSRSNAYGIYNEVVWKLKPIKKLVTFVGMTNETCFAEWFSSKHESDTDVAQHDGNGYNWTYDPPVHTESIPKHFFLSSSALSAFYRVSLNTEKALRPSLQLSLGTNLYSDWSQFRKCAWIGIGINCEWVRRTPKE